MASQHEAYVHQKINFSALRGNSLLLGLELITKREKNMRVRILQFYDYVGLKLVMRPHDPIFMVLQQNSLESKPFSCLSKASYSSDRSREPLEKGTLGKIRLV